MRHSQKVLFLIAAVFLMVGGAVAAEKESKPLSLTAIAKLISKGSYKEIRKRLKDEQPTDITEAVLATIDLLEKQQADMITNAKKLVGKQVSLKMKKGTAEGKVADASASGITLVIQLVINRQVMGETKRTLPWDDIASSEKEKLVGIWPTTDTGQIARVLIVFSQGNIKAVEAMVKVAPKHVLITKIKEEIALNRTSSTGAAAKKAWARIEAKYKAGQVAVSVELALDREVRKFLVRYGRLSDELRSRIAKVGARVKGASGLVGHWTFDEGQGTVAHDSSKNKNGAVLSGGQWARGRIGGAFRTTAQSDRITVARNPALDPPSAITVALWVNIDGTAFDSYADLVRKSNCGGSGYNVRWSHRNGCLRWAPKAGVLRVDDTAQNATYHNAWHHVCGTYDSVTGVAILYVDGAERSRKKDAPARLTHSGDLFFMGADYFKQATVLGLIDDVRIYRRAISAREVAALVRGK